VRRSSRSPPSFVPAARDACSVQRKARSLASTKLQKVASARTARVCKPRERYARRISASGRAAVPAHGRARRPSIGHSPRRPSDVDLLVAPQARTSARRRNTEDPASTITAGLARAGTVRPASRRAMLDEVVDRRFSTPSRGSAVRGCSTSMSRRRSASGVIPDWTRPPLGHRQMTAMLRAYSRRSMLTNAGPTPPTERSHATALSGGRAAPRWDLAGPRLPPGDPRMISACTHPAGTCPVEGHAWRTARVASARLAVAPQYVAGRPERNMTAGGLVYTVVYRTLPAATGAHGACARWRSLAAAVRRARRYGKADSASANVGPAGSRVKRARERHPLGTITRGRAPFYAIALAMSSPRIVRLPLTIPVGSPSRPTGPPLPASWTGPPRPRAPPACPPTLIGPPARAPGTADCTPGGRCGGASRRRVRAGHAAARVADASTTSTGAPRSSAPPTGAVRSRPGAVPLARRSRGGPRP
jgi:hypothetical protein